MSDMFTYQIQVRDTARSSTSTLYCLLLRVSWWFAVRTAISLPTFSPHHEVYSRLFAPFRLSAHTVIHFASTIFFAYVHTRITLLRLVCCGMARYGWFPQGARSYIRRATIVEIYRYRLC
ncbi:hypothetical protein M404DRAFT_329602 [Pisolithus tinctorius Marx 270]|uniref:Uncharacterized protein n=1 Tax=Pisolithus tinctorius Marx 270 TaxID=870435 RepID=A0A0C3IDS0_PISTI|nr:hypothetical protein M404DRAFT_329602 [Pisolithus tinctorius Marx 270]